MAELWEGLRQRQDVVFGDDNEIAILGCQGASLSLLSPCGQRIFSKRSPFHKPREQHLVARQLQDDAGGEEEATRFQDFDDQRCVSPAASAPRLREAR